VLEIPPPVSKENADEYFEVLAKKEAEKDAEKWIEKHFIEDSHYDSDNDSSNNIIPVIKPPPNLFGVFLFELLTFGPVLIILELNFILAIIACAFFSVLTYVMSVISYNKKIKMKNYDLGSNSKQEKGWVGDVILFTLVFLIILFLLFIWFVIWLTENLTMSTM
jgi:hypothetical protein